MESRIYNVNLQSGYNTLTYIGISQYDAGVPLQFNVYDGATAASFPAGTTATIMGVRPSGVGFSIACTLTDNIVTVDTVTDMTGEAGKFPVEIRFTASGVDVGTVNFVFIIEKAPHPDGTVDADITRQQTFIERLEAVEDDKVPFPSTNKYGIAGQVLSTLGDGTTEWINRASGQGVSEDLKAALLQIAQKVAYIDEDGQDYYDALYDALYPPAPPATLVSISAVYTQSGTVYDTDTLDSLKTDLIVTAHYDNSTSAVVTTYTLSGTLTVGTSTITVSYNGKTTTFNVTVTEYVDPRVLLYNWDFTQSLIDTVGGSSEFILSNATQDSSGIHLSAGNSYALNSSLIDSDRTYEVDIASFTNDLGGVHGRLFMPSKSGTNATNGFIYNRSGSWQFYLGSWSGETVYTDVSLAGKTLVIKIDTNRIMKAYIDDVLIATSASALDSTFDKLFLGSNSGNSYITCAITGLRVYEGV